MSKPGLDKTEIIFAAGIAILYPFFFTKLVNRISGYDDTSKKCEALSDDYYHNIDLMNKDDVKKKQLDDCRKQRDSELDKIELNKHIMLLTVAIVTIIGSSMIKTGSTKVGVGFGGVLTLIVALSLYWRKYGETTKIVITGLCLAVTVYMSMRLYKVQNISDLFSIEFGTK